MNSLEGQPPRLLIVSSIRMTIDAFFGPHIAALRSRGLEVHLASGDDGRNNLGFSRRPTSLLRLQPWRRYRRMVSDLRPQLILTTTPVAGALARLSPRIAGEKVIYLAHGFHFQPGEISWRAFLFRQIERLLALRSDGIIVINQSDLEEIEDWKLRSGIAQSITGIGVVDPGFRWNPIEARRVTHLGRLDKNKRVDLLIRAAAIAGDVKVDVIGDGPEMKSLRRLSSELGVDTTFHGFLADPWRIAHASNVVTLTSAREGVPVALLEALVVGVPVVATGNRGSYELNNQVGGILLVEPTADAVATGLSRAFESPASIPPVNERSLSNYGAAAVSEELAEIVLDNLKLLK